MHMQDMHDSEEQSDAEPLVSLDPVARQLLQLLMRSQDLGDGPCGGGGDDGDGDDDDAPVVGNADIELDLTTRQAPQDSQATPEEESDGLPPGVAEFCRELGVDPSTVPLPAIDGPAADPGASFERLLSGEVNPISVLQVQLVSQKTKVPPGSTSQLLGVRNLALCGRLTKAGVPGVVTRDGKIGVRLRIEDVQKDDVGLLVIDPALAGLPAAQVVNEVMTRFPAGTAIAVVGFDMSVQHTNFAVVCDLGDDDRAVHRLGAAELPSLKLSQVRRSVLGHRASDRTNLVLSILFSEALPQPFMLSTQH